MQGILACFLALGAAVALAFGKNLGLEPPLIGALAGALLGSAATMLGTFIARLQIRRDNHSRVRALRTLITAELINLAVSYIEATQLLSTALRAISQRALVPEILDFSKVLPRDMPLTATLRAELLLLPEQAVDVLVTLASNTGRTRELMQDMSKRPFGLLSAQQAAGVVSHDMRVLAEAFERIAPERKMQLDGSEPEIASVLLRRFADDLSKTANLPA